jgi:dTDP-glucose 4,6-dehydratase
MRLLVTGGAGFIGSNFVRGHLDRSDDEVVILDALTYAGNRSTIADLLEDPRVRFVHGDICDRSVVPGAMEGCEAVVHFAAASHVDRSIVASDEFMRTNCLGTNVLCDTARSAGVERFVHVSTDEVYGSIAQGSFREDDPLGPRSPYAASKAASDMVVLAHRETYGLPVVVTRCSNNYGPWQFPEKVIPLFLTNLLDGLVVPLYGAGANVRDWLHVSDHCAALEVILEAGELGGIYNVGGGTELTNLELTRRILAVVGAGEEMVERVADRLGHDFRYSVETGRLRALGWEPAVDFAEGLADTVAWYRANEWWWRPLKGGG